MTVSQINILIGSLGGFLTGLLAVFFTVVYIKEVRPKRNYKRKLKCYNKLLYGTPKRIKTMYTNYDLFNNSTKPIWIDGEVYGRVFYGHFGRWHINEESVSLVRVSDGEKFFLEPARFPHHPTSCLRGRSEKRYVKCKQFAVVEEVY